MRGWMVKTRNQSRTGRYRKALQMYWNWYRKTDLRLHEIVKLAPSRIHNL